jgi:exodeoxyribonuclease V alpha subunit
MNEDFEFIDLSAEDNFNVSARNTLVQKINELRAAGNNLLTDVAIITTNNFGELGVNKLNDYLRTVINGDKKQKIYIRGVQYFINDKLLYKRNNYDMNLYNGDMGVVKYLNWSTQSITADFYGRKVEMDYRLLKDTISAYVSTVHSIQGNEFPVVIFILPRFAEPLLNTRNLLYTAVTRAKQKLILISTKQTVWLSIDNKKELKRMTLLGKFIDKIISSEETIWKNN